MPEVLWGKALLTTTFWVPPSAFLPLPIDRVTFHPEWPARKEAAAETVRPGQVGGVFGSVSSPAPRRWAICPVLSVTVGK